MGFAKSSSNEKKIVPTDIKITNKSIGANKYLWKFLGGNPDSSNTANPPIIRYTQGGRYAIKLIITNKFNQTSEFQKEIILDDSIILKLQFTNHLSMHTPVDYVITNTSKGVKNHLWIIEDGEPSSSTDLAPNIRFTTPGKHKISYTATNDVIKYGFDTTITVLGDVANDFDFKWMPIDNDMEVPFILNVRNKSNNAFSYSWSITSDKLTAPFVSTDTNIQYTILTAGTYLVSLTAQNDKRSITKSMPITVLPNSNVFRLSNLKIGIHHTQQNQLGSFFSINDQAIVHPDSLDTYDKKNIVWGFYSFDNTFQSCQFFSPSNVNTFYSNLNFINAPITTIVNRADLCNCSLYGTRIEDFDNIYDDHYLKNLDINSADIATKNFSIYKLPYLVFFKTQDNRKGIIKIKEFINNGYLSYITVDIKVMKNP